MKDSRIVVGISGASGVTVACRLIEVLGTAGFETHVVVTRAAQRVARIEGVEPGGDHLHDVDDLSASVASGSFPTGGMVVVPCSMNTLGKLANGIEDNLLLRAAAVTLKEGRRLVVVPRETPVSEVHLKNMLALKRAGADVVLPVLTFYHEPVTVGDLVDFVVGRVLDLFGIGHSLYRRWG
ncbi:MAG: UbiX family flavin prenyltransferase [Promethearchaeota archaeon]